MNKTLQNLFVIPFLLASLIGFAQPANDDCANAIVITEGNGQSFSTIDATSDGPAHANDCVSSGTTPDSTYNDIWYSYTASFTGQAEWSFCGSADFDTKIFVYGSSAACPPTDADIVGCNEDETGCNNSTSVAIFDVTMGVTYLLRVGGYGDGGPGESGSGTFNLGEFISNAPDNDNCTDAQEIMIGTGQDVLTLDATTDGPEHPNNPCFGFGDNTIQADVWYSFTPTYTGSAQWSTCSTVNFDSRLGVYTGSCPFTDDDLIACNDDGGGCLDFTSSVIFDVVMGETYHLRLGGYNAAVGSGSMDLIEIIPPTPPSNDLCSNAENVFVMSAQEADDGVFEFSGSTIAADFDSDSFLFPKCIGNTNGGEFADVWYTFDPAGLTEVEIRFFSLTIDGSYYLDIWEDCDSLAMDPITEDCFFIDSSTDLFLMDTILNLDTTKSLYYIRVVTRLTSDNPGDFVFQLVGDVPAQVSVEELPLKEFKFYPNPVSDMAQLEFELPDADDIQIEIVDILGQRIYFDDKGRLASGKHNFSLNMDSFSQGIYFLTVRSDEQVKSIKFIKE